MYMKRAVIDTNVDDDYNLGGSPNSGPEAPDGSYTPQGSRQMRVRSADPDIQRQRQQRSVNWGHPAGPGMALPRGVQRQSRNGAAFSGWVTVEGYRLLGPARPTAEQASDDRRRLAEAKAMGGLPEARKVVASLHAEVASSRRMRSSHMAHSILGGSSRGYGAGAYSGSLSPSNSLGVHYARKPQQGYAPSHALLAQEGAEGLADERLEGDRSMVGGAYGSADSGSQHAQSGGQNERSVPYRPTYSGAALQGTSLAHLPANVAQVTPLFNLPSRALHMVDLRMYAYYSILLDSETKSEGDEDQERPEERTLGDKSTSSDKMAYSDKMASSDRSASSHTATPLSKDPQWVWLEFGPLCASPAGALNAGLPAFSEGVSEANTMDGSPGSVFAVSKSIWGYCVLCEVMICGKVGFVGGVVFGDVLVPAGPARGSKDAAIYDAGALVAGQISSMVHQALIPGIRFVLNPAEDLFTLTTATGAAEVHVLPHPEGSSALAASSVSASLSHGSDLVDIPPSAQHHGQSHAHGHQPIAHGHQPLAHHPSAVSAELLKRKLEANAEAVESPERDEHAFGEKRSRPQSLGHSVGIESEATTASVLTPANSDQGHTLLGHR